MPKWNNQFDQGRMQPAFDLLNALTITNVEKAIDLGCGIGKSTFALKQYYPEAEVFGLDWWEDVVKRASELYPDILFYTGDVFELQGSYDLIFSNACLQLVPGHEELLPFLYYCLNRGGQLAIQMPRNDDSPLYRAVEELASDPEWDDLDFGVVRSATLSEEEYFDILSKVTPNFSIWETTYYQRLKDHETMISWVKNNRLQELYAELNEERQELLTEKIAEVVKKYYPVRSNGEVVYECKRMFLIASKSL